MTISDWLDEISVKFDELGFVPTTLTDEKSEHFVEWFATEISEIKKEEERLKAENEQLKQTFSRMETVEKELRERLEKAVELPCKVGDTVWFFDSDRILKEGKISMLQCKSDGNWKMRITYNLVSYKTVFDDYCNKLGIKYFTDNTEAKARLAELGGKND